MDNDVVKKVMYSALVTAISAIMAIIGRKSADQIWVRFMGEEPPRD